MSVLDKYLAHAEGVTGYRRNLARMGKLNGNSSTLFGSQALASHVAAMPPPAIQWGIPTAAGLVAGGIIGYKHDHWLLGAMSGASLFTNAPHLLKSETRGEAFWNLAQTHGGVFGSLAMKDNKAAGFVLGWLAIGIARHFYGAGK